MCIIIVILVYIVSNMHNCINNNSFIKIDQSIRVRLHLPQNVETNLKMYSLEEAFNKRISTNISEDVKMLIAWIQLNSTVDARILVEDSGIETNHTYGGGHITSIFPHLTGRLFFKAYGTYVLTRDDIKVASFWNKRFLGQTIGKYNESDLKEIFSTYNIKWIIAFSRVSKDKFESYPALLKKIDEIGNFSIYETNILPTYFIRGNGTVHVDFNIIQLANVSKGDIILKFPYNPDCISKPKLMMQAKDYKYTQTYYGFIWIQNNSYSNINITC
jgi:hypothetical protein